MILLLTLGIGLLVAAGVPIWLRPPYERRVALLKRAVPGDAGSIANAFPREVISLRGTPKPIRKLVSDYTNTPCIFYEYKVERQYERRRAAMTEGQRPRPQQRQHADQRSPRLGAVDPAGAGNGEDVSVRGGGGNDHGT